MDQYHKQKGGIYIHVPFCIKKCAYCDFYSGTDLEKIQVFVDSLMHEIDMRADISWQADTIYIGGGTPSLMASEQVQALIDKIIRNFNISSDAEITIEVNPGTMTAEKLAGFHQAGVNRVNIGVQSFSNPALEFLTRIHTAEEAIQSVAAARSVGFNNIGLDLIYGLPGQAENMWKADLQAAIDLHPEHLSCYMLTFEPGTRMEKDLRNSHFQPMSDKDVGRLYEFTVRFLEDNGFYQYEVSNFSTSYQTRSRHNQKYWTHAPYIGLGPSAHSFMDKRRSWNVRSLEVYLKQTGQGQLPVEETEELNIRQLMIETLYLRLRCVEGISIPDFEKRFNVDFIENFGSIVATYVADGFLEIENCQLRLTRKGMLFTDSIASRFIDLI